MHFSNGKLTRSWLGNLGVASGLIGIGVVIGAIIAPGVVGPSTGSGSVNGSDVVSRSGPDTGNSAQLDATGPTSPIEWPADGAAGDQPHLSAGALWHPWSPGPGELGANPMAFSIDHVINGRTAKKVVSSWTRNEDTPEAPLVNTRAVGDDNGQIFTPYDALPSTFTMVATTRLRDGAVLSASFVPVTSPAPNRFAISMAKSTDVAKSWKTWNAPIIEDKWKLGWYRIHRDMIELQDGTLLLGGYGKGTIDGVTKEYSIVLESHDGGQTFSQRSAVNAGSDYGTNEMGMTRTADGRLIAVMRGVEPNPRPPAMPMTQTFSDDDGKTWEPVKLFVPPNGLPNNGIMPKPMLQPNGQLLMTYGRPDNNVVISKDGTGKTWDVGETIYGRYPGKDPLRRWQGSSGNMDIVSLNNSSSLAFGDNCHNIWMCREYGHDNKIWTRKVDAMVPGVGKIDLATKVRDGRVKLSGSVLPHDDHFPEQRIEGAVDGSGEYRAAARLDRRQQLTIELDRMYTLDRIGLMMSKGELNGAKVQVSENGEDWSSPVLRTGERSDWAMHYDDIEPVKARFVKISRDGRAPLTAVTEIELYAKNLLTFENDAITSVPRTLKDARYALVADQTVPGYDHSSARMVLIDADQGARAGATFPAAHPAPHQHAAFGFEGYGYGSGALWDILGTDAQGKEVTAFRLHFLADWTGNAMVARAWDGNAWVEVGRAGPAIANKEWMSVTLDSTDAATKIILNGKELGTTTALLADVDAYTGFRAETGLDPADVGNMEHSYDDVEIAPLQ